MSKLPMRLGAPAFPALFTRMSTGPAASIAALHRVVVGHVERHRPRLTAAGFDLADHRLGALLEQVVHEHFGARGGEHVRDAATHVLTGSGHERAVPGEVDGHRHTAPASCRERISSAVNPASRERRVGVRARLGGRGRGRVAAGLVLVDEPQRVGKDRFARAAVERDETAARGDVRVVEQILGTS